MTKNDIKKERKHAFPNKNDDSRSTFLANLMSKREEVQGVLDRLKNSQKEYKNVISASDFIDEIDQAEHEISAQTYYSLLERKNLEMEKIEFLISKLQQDEDFGQCDECGEPIPEARLLIVPEATRCVPCQQEVEKFDSKRFGFDRSLIVVGNKKELDWEETGDAEEKDSFNIETDMEGMSLLDMDETDLDRDPN
jgi:DnaK suppressor protein